MAMFLMPSFLVESNKAPTKQANGQFLVSL